MSVLAELFGPAGAAIFAVLRDESIPKETRATVIKDLVQGTYGSYAEQVRPVLPLLPELAEQFGSDLSVIGTALLSLVDAAVQEESCREALKRHDRVVAARDREQYNAYMDEGFSQDQAFALVLQRKARSPVSQSARSMAAQSAGESVASEMRTK